MIKSVLIPRSQARRVPPRDRDNSLFPAETLGYIAFHLNLSAMDDNPYTFPALDALLFVKGWYIAREEWFTARAKLSAP